MSSKFRSISWLFVAMVAILCFANSATRSEAQTVGNNAVYNSNARCSSPTSCGFSGAFIDASVFGNSSTNICSVLHAILIGTLYPASGAVIDARGLPGTTGTSMQCATNPWAGRRDKGDDMKTLRPDFSLTMRQTRNSQGFPAIPDVIRRLHSLTPD